MGCLAPGLAIALLVLPAAAMAATYNVMPDGSGDYPTIQAAINAAAEGDTVLLSNGVFHGPENRNISFLGKAIVVCSSADNPDSCVIDCEGNGEEIRRGFVFELTEGHGSVLRGVSIRNGIAFHSNPGYAEYGGGVYCASASPTIENCRISNCQAEIGGGICVTNGSPTIADCEVSDCFSEFYGGGMYLENGPFHVAACTVRNCLSQRDGGGIALAYLNSGVSELLQCDVYGNDALDHGGGVNATSVGSVAELVLRDCVLNRNNSGGNGGGCSIQASEGASVTIEGCEVVSNFAWGYGGGISGQGSNYTTWEILGCTVIENVADHGAGISFTADLEFYLHNSVVAYNLDGGGFRYPPGCIADVSCCDIHGNEGGDWVGPLWDFYPPVSG